MPRLSGHTALGTGFFQTIACCIFLVPENFVCVLEVRDQDYAHTVIPLQ